MSAEQQPDEGDEFRVESPWLHAVEVPQGTPQTLIDAYRASGLLGPEPASLHAAEPRAAEIPVTEEMVEAGREASDNEPVCGDPAVDGEQWFRAIYRAMAALAPKETPPVFKRVDGRGTPTPTTVSWAYFSQTMDALNRCRESLGQALDTSMARNHRIAALEAENATLKAGLDLVRDARMLANDGDSPTDVHERAQRVARDILAGQVTRDDRHTVQEALKAAPKEPATIRPLTNTGDPRRVGG